MPERTKPQPHNHLELTIKYTVPTRQADVNGILTALEVGFDAVDGDTKFSIPGGGRAELVKSRTVPAPT